MTRVSKQVRATGATFPGITKNIFYALLFFHTHYWYVVDMCDTESVGGTSTDVYVVEKILECLVLAVVQLSRGFSVD